MSSFLNLVWNEWLKMYKKKSFFVAFAIMAVIAIFTAVVISQTGLNDTMGRGEHLALVLGIDGFGSLFVLIAIIGIASIVSMEHHLGTVKFLLIRANSRSKILASKYVTMILYMLVLLAFTTVLSLITGFLLLNSSDSSWSIVFQNIGSTFVYGLVYCTITFMFSVLTRSTGATIGIGMFLVFFEGMIVMLLRKYEWIKYTLFYHTNLSVYMNDGTTSWGTSLTYSIVVLTIYLAAFLAISFAVYNKRDI